MLLNSSLKDPFGQYNQIPHDGYKGTIIVCCYRTRHFESNILNSAVYKYIRMGKRLLCFIKLA